jgi:hypothetical protein
MWLYVLGPVAALEFFGRALGHYLSHLVAEDAAAMFANERAAHV